MTPLRRQNLLRLLKPRHVALIGGRDTVTVAGELARIGYPGPVWPVNPKRGEIGGHPCFARIEDLPEPPDAVFLAIPAEAAIEAVATLERIGAGGVVVYTAGFGETGSPRTTHVPSGCGTGVPDCVSSDIPTSLWAGVAVRDASSKTATPGPSSWIASLIAAARGGGAAGTRSSTHSPALSATRWLCTWPM